MRRSCARCHHRFDDGGGVLFPSPERGPDVMPLCAECLGAVVTFIRKGAARDFGEGTFLLHDGERYVRGRVLCPDGALRRFSIIRDFAPSPTELRIVIQKRLSPTHSVNICGEIDLTEQPLRFRPDPARMYADVFATAGAAP